MIIYWIKSNEDLIRRIKNKDLGEIRFIFENSSMEIDLLLFLNHIIEQPHENINYISLLLYFIENHRKSYAELLINNGPLVNKDILKEALDEPVYSKNKLRDPIIISILEMKNDVSLITSDVLCKLIYYNNESLFSFILNYKYKNNTDNIIMMRELLLIYKNKIPLSNEELNTIFFRINKEVININAINENGNYPLIYAFYKGNMTFVKFLIDYAERKNITLDLYTKNRYDKYPLLEAIKKNKTEIVKLLLQYAHAHHKIKLGDCNLIIEAVKNKNIEIVKTLMEYAQKHIIIFDLNKADNYGFYPLLEAVKCTNILELLMTYAKNNNIILELNKSNIRGHYPLLNAINNTESIKLLMDYARDNGIILELNEKDNLNIYPILKAVKKNEMEAVKLLIGYANENNTILKLDENIVLNVILNNNYEIFTLLMNYVEEKNDILEINCTDYYYGNPLIAAIRRDNIEVVTSLLDYAQKKNIILDLNYNNYYVDYPIIEAIRKNNFDIVNLLISYAKENNIILKINEKYKNSSILETIDSNYYEIVNDKKLKPFK